MGILYEKLLRPILFLQDPEKAHDSGIAALRLIKKLGALCWLMERWNLVRTQKPIELFGLTFPNPVGLAAGMDKNGVCWQAGAAFGFGHVEIGTITFQKQPGNPRPRIFRYLKEEAIINRLGFNNDGATAVAERLAKHMGRCKKRRTLLGINIGKSKTVPLENSAEDYLASFRLLADFADYFTINISSPNTPGLRKLQDKQLLRGFLSPLIEAKNDRAHKMGQRAIPMLVKIAPDLSFRQIDYILEVITELGFDGVVATNTTTKFPFHLSDMGETGGLSGKPLEKRSTQIVKYIHSATEGKLPIVGVGGIYDVESASRKMDAGAKLIQIYTGFVYRGPFTPKVIARGLANRNAEWI